MAIPKMNDDVEIISKLGDVPGSDDGLSTQQLKSKFDLAAVRIKLFINNVLIPAIENSVSEDGLLSQVYSALSKKLDISGGTLTGAINMNGKRLYNLKDPADEKDAASKKYVDTTVKEYLNSAHLDPVVELSTNWSGSSAPYTQTVSVSGILKDDNPHYAVVYSDDQETRLKQREAFGCIDDLETENGKVTFICFDEKPGIALEIQLEVNR